MSRETESSIADYTRSWFALSVKPRHEKSCAAALRQKGFEEFLPLYRSERRWSDRTKEVDLPLFAGYAFCRFEAQSKLPILTTPGVLRIVGSGKEPTPIPDTEIEALRSVVNAGLTAEPCPYFEAGATVVVDGGPLRGVEGTLLEVKQQERLVLSVSMLQRSVAVEVDRRWVRPLLRRAAAGR